MVLAAGKGVTQLHVKLQLHKVANSLKLVRPLCLKYLKLWDTALSP